MQNPYIQTDPPYCMAAGLQTTPDARVTFEGETLITPGTMYAASQ